VTEPLVFRGHQCETDKNIVRDVFPAGIGNLVPESQRYAQLAAKLARYSATMATPPPLPTRYPWIPLLTWRPRKSHPSQMCPA
jgi:hypothetical protein